MTYRLVLLRHGQSEWNARNLFTGWWDADLTDLGQDEARRGGRDLAAAGVLPDVAHTSLQVRAIRTTNLALDECERLWVPVRRSWRLNERHYGDLTGRDKKQTAEKYGADQVKIWRRSYDVPPPPIAADNEYDPASDPRYADLPPDVIPKSECLKDVVARTLPYFYDAIVPDLRTGGVVLIGAHGNSLRALVKHLDGISDADIAEVNLPTGVPLLYELGSDFLPLDRGRDPLDRALGDPDAVRQAAAAVANQASSGPENPATGS
jgi:2,3-bisphosphoglycerate-dependent phosphoglycerate mutase